MPNFVNGTDASEVIDAADGVSNSRDIIDGFAGDDTIFGLGGDDLLVGGAGADILDGGSGNDGAWYANDLVGVIVSLASGQGFGGFAEGDTLINIENISGTNANDILVGNNGSNYLGGGGGEDVLKGGGGADELYGGSSADVLQGGTGADKLDGGIGFDSATYSDSDAGVVVNLASGLGSGGTAQGDTLSSIEHLTGSDFADWLLGNAKDNHLSGGAGDDVLKGAGGADTLSGGSGVDTVSYMESPEGVVVFLCIDHASGGDAEGDELNSIENLTGSNHADTLGGSDGANVLSGGSGNDILKGYGGADTLIGGAGFDTLYGDGGSDVITGGAGQDTMYGRANADTFKITSLTDAPAAGYGFTDYLPDFSSAQGDKIDLSAIDANTTLGGNQAFTPIGIEVTFTGSAGELRFNGGFLEGDVNGDGIADFQIELDVASLNAATDLVL